MRRRRAEVTLPLIPVLRPAEPNSFDPLSNHAYTTDAPLTRPHAATRTMTDTTSGGRIIVIGSPAPPIWKPARAEGTGKAPAPQGPLSRRVIVIKDGEPVAD